MALLGVQAPVRTKTVDAADIVRDAYLRQQSGFLAFECWCKETCGWRDRWFSPGCTHGIASRTERHASVDRGTTLGLRFD